MEGQNWFYISHNDPTASNELAHRINCWRQNVELQTSMDLTNSSSQHLFPCESVPLSLPTRAWNSRRRKPYTRPPDPPRHQKVPHMDFSDLHNVEPMSFLDTQVRGVREVAKRVVEDDCGTSGFSPSFGDSPGLDLPHPEKNPLITCHPDVLKGEYCRLAFLYGRLNMERNKADVQWLQTASQDVMASIMDLGTKIRRVVDAAQYVVMYGQVHGWDIDFEALEYAAQPPTPRALPSSVRELVCSPDILNHRDSSAEWHLYPAA